jgi:hypothetical protein
MSELKIGMIGLDTSHCPAFTRVLNDEQGDEYIPGGRVVAAWPGGSEAFSLSVSRVEGFTDELRDDFGVEIKDDIPSVVDSVDAILLTSVDGRQHPEQFEQVACGKPVFIDKPFATSGADARAIIDVAQKTNTPLMSTSTARFASGIADLVNGDEEVVSAHTFGPMDVLDDYPGLYWYGIHSAEMLFRFMGKGCGSVRCVEYDRMDIISAEWSDGRVGTLRGNRIDCNDFGCTVHVTDGIRHGAAAREPSMHFMGMKEILKFFQSGQPPIDIEETYEIALFLERAFESRQQGGVTLSL